MTVRLLFLSTILCSAAASVSAQPRADFGVGYEYEQLARNSNLPAGISVDLAGRAGSGLSAVVQVDWARRSESIPLFNSSVESTVAHSSIAVGVRVGGSDMKARTRPILQVLVGEEHIANSSTGGPPGLPLGASSYTEGMIEAGAGFAVRIAGRFGAFGQVNFLQFLSGGCRTGCNALKWIGGARVTLP